MSAALAPALELDQAADRIDLGTAVRISPRGGRRLVDMTEEGVVIRVVQAGQAIGVPRVSYAGSIATSHSSVPRYVVQTWTQRLVRLAGEMLVVAL